MGTDILAIFIELSLYYNGILSDSFSFHFLTSLWAVFCIIKKCAICSHNYRTIESTNKASTFHLDLLYIVYSQCHSTHYLWDQYNILWNSSFGATQNQCPEFSWVF